ncbi:sodium:solute symporter family protein [Calderihabitans maritimus]|uniref:Uncharacterized protein n=1 Tax=Calderihabitans maritimus TaxID=1246530 RepID=A0A1Z5HU52_9FIRM|nr:sodium:pantothenate symporter [Calderihabitans maritimus]GAW93069.1 hypothetical protein KKC1_22100 [Calderihabitans maritimus]
MNQQVIIYVWVALAIYIAIVLYLGYLGSKKTTSIKDFTIGGGKLGPYVTGLAFAATFFSAATVVGYVGWAYAWGYSALWVFLAIFGGSTLGVLTFARKAREANITLKAQSLADWLGEFYGSDFVRLGTALILIFNLFYVGAQLSAGAYMFNVLIGLPYNVGLALITIIVTSYVFAGGTVADVYTDAFQAVLMVLMGITVFVSGLFLIPEGGFGTLFNETTRVLHQAGPELTAVLNPQSAHFYAVSAVVGVFIIEYAFAAQPQLFNKVLALRSASELRKMIITYLIAAFLIMLVIFTGFYARVFGLAPKAPDHTIYEYVARVFPPIVSALLAMVILSAALSTTDGLIVVLSTVVGYDIFRKFLVRRGIIKLSPEEADKKALQISRITTGLVGLIAALLVVKPPAFLGTFIWIGISGIASGTLGPLIIGLFMPKRATAKAAITSMICGVSAYLIIYFGHLEKSVMASGAWATLIGVAVMLVMTLARAEKIDTDHKTTVKN